MWVVTVRQTHDAIAFRSGYEAPFRALTPTWARTAPSLAINGLLAIQRFRQREQRQQMSNVLLQPTEAHRHQAELALDHAEGKFDLRTNARVAMLLLLQQRLDRAVGHLRDVAGARGDVTLQVFPGHVALGAPIAGVCQDLLFLARQRVGNLLHVGFVGWRW